MHTVPLWGLGKFGVIFKTRIFSHKIPVFFLKSFVILEIEIYTVFNSYLNSRSCQVIFNTSTILFETPVRMNSLYGKLTVIFSHPLCT